VWDILGLNGPTVDIRKIKAAYALKLEALEAANHTEELEKLHEAFQSAIHYSDSESPRITGEASEAVYQELDEISTSTDSILDAAQTQTLQAEASQFVLEQNAEELICTDFRSQYFETYFKF